mmetsp:Transcript_48731/g.152965  ORF Transcript_48731/g.152965 Transcript_48731/m.152965 type:complete len:173 (-) Transcript_48731:2026-2544(-)
MAGVGEAVDEALMAYLKDVDEYQTSMAEVVAACKAGMLELARARKSMGFKGCAVSQLQYPSRMKASRKVVVKDENEGEGILANSDNDQFCDGKRIFVEAIESIPEQTEDEDPVFVDPIKWFGVLVPSSLRVSQKGFVRAVESAAAASAAYINMKRDYARFRHLLSSKKKITE